MVTDVFLAIILAFLVRGLFRFILYVLNCSDRFIDFF